MSFLFIQAICFLFKGHSLLSKFTSSSGWNLLGSIKYLNQHPANDLLNVCKTDHWEGGAGESDCAKLALRILQDAPVWLNAYFFSRIMVQNQMCIKSLSPAEIFMQINSFFFQFSSFKTVPDWGDVFKVCPPTKKRHLSHQLIDGKYFLTVWHRDKNIKNKKTVFL